MKDKNHMILSIDVKKKHLIEIQHPFMIKTPSTVGIEGTYESLSRKSPAIVNITRMVCTTSM